MALIVVYSFAEDCICGQLGLTAVILLAAQTKDVYLSNNVLAKHLLFGLVGWLLTFIKTKSIKCTALKTVKFRSRYTALCSAGQKSLRCCITVNEP